MARLNINIGINANDGTGDDIRTAMQKINTNFTELYAETLVDSGISISGNTISSNRSDDDIVFEPSGTGGVRFPAILINDNAITGTRSNEDLTIVASGTGNLILGSLRVNGTTISSDDSSKITLAENVDITGNLQVNEISSADSSNIYINDGLNVSGTLTANSFVTNTIISSESTAVEVADGLTVAGTLTANTFITNAISSSESSAIQINDALNVSGTLSADVLDVNEISSGDSSAIQINDAVNISGTLTANGTLDARTIVTNDISSSDSTAIQVNDGMNVSGTLSVDTLDVNEINSGDSTAIQVNDAVNVSGTLTANSGFVANAITYPTADGTPNQVLTTNGSGTLSFTSVTAAAAGSNGQIQFNTGGNLAASANLSWDGTTLNAANIRVSGDLTVDGEQTIINTTTLQVEDNIIELNRNVSENSQVPTYSGLKINRGELSTATEQDVYWVWDESFAEDGSTYETANAGGAWTALRSADGNTNSGPNQIDPTDSSLVDVRCRIIRAVATSAQYADLAELYLADADYAVGTVVCIGGTKEVTAARYGDAAIGVVSAQPAFLMNKTLQGGTVIALKGRVPVLVQGTVKKGDKLLPAQNTQGAASAADRSSADYFAIALEDHQSGSGTIECLVL